MDFSKFKRWPVILGLIICLIAVITVVIFNFTASNKAQASVSATNSAEKSGTAELPKDSATNNSQTDLTQPQSSASQTASSQPQTSNFKEFFKNDAFLGDSISEGLSFYDFLDDSRVIADKGLSITKGIDEADKIIALKPQRVFILIGLNEADDRTASSTLVDEYTKLVEKLKTSLPNSKIYVTSILPVLENLVKNSHLNNAHIKECNAGLIDMANKENVNYVNLASILNDSNKNLYEDDGIHYKSDFYRMWLTYLENLLKN
ncbi:lysophospholipase L1-like esterase [Desulfosporosinus acidiphilus SJ4]|uniref:Lysophospholipase L1-like esterase n=1 Tax=Desulfosporosinus acidiphilus (strain DSM 22704 / JCM 16185 / SJ4) TaxID=646529 RepID=I4D113_DESAJ|nr:GDSL-type esterase/lipase family protein [Desulfosporosinus acidiphilus]AFM39487.1 lysophospholipase L1-like esterase [Desulfosporosinus acidiphilus SJ4]